MREQSTLRIGEFARVAQVSIATLRHYDQCGLLKPYALDQDTGYRYYSLDQLPRLNRILALKDLGFPLEQITRLLEEDLSLEQLRGMFTLKQAQTQHMINVEQARLTRIAARLRQIEQEGIMPTYDILLKQVEPLHVASVRKIIPIGEDLGQSFKTILTYLDELHIPHPQPGILLLHSRYEWYKDVLGIDVEAVVPLLATLPHSGHINTRTLPGTLVASTVHMGDDLALGQAHAALYSWMKDNEYQIIGPPRQLQLQRASYIDPDQYITEVQLPVSLASHRI